MRSVPARTTAIFLGLGLPAAIFLVCCSELLRHFPMVNSDEVIVASSADSFMKGSGIRYPLYDDIFAPSIYGFRDTTIEEGRPIYAGFVGLWTKLLPRNLYWLRASSMAAGLILVFLLYVIGMTYGPSVARWSVILLLGSPVFWVSSCITGEHVLVAVCGAAMLALTVATPAFPWKRFLIGCLGGIGVGIHPNIICFMIGFGIFWIAGPLSSKTKRRDISLLSLGVISGAILALATVNWKHYVLMSRTIYWTFVQPPIFTSGFSFFESLKGLLIMVINPTSYYFASHGTPTFSDATLFYSAALIIGVLMTATKQWSTAKPFFYGSASVALSMVLLMNRREMTYGLLILPFLIPLAAIGLGTAWDGRVGVQRMARVTVMTILLAGFGLFARFISIYIRENPDFPTIAGQVEKLRIDPSLKIAGPNFFWFLHSPETMRDIGALVISRYDSGRQVSLEECLTKWKPDIIVFDPLLKRIFFGTREPQTILMSSLPLNGVQRVGTIGSSTFGPYDVYRLRWAPNVTQK